MFMYGLLYFNSNETIDINIHDTYFVIAQFHLSLLLALLLFVIGFVYFIHLKTKIYLISFLSKTHTFITIGCIGIYFLILSFPSSSSNNDFPLFNEDTYIDKYLILIPIIAVLSQLILLINSIISTFKLTLQRLRISQ